MGVGFGSKGAIKPLPLMAGNGGGLFFTTVTASTLRRPTRHFLSIDSKFTHWCTLTTTRKKERNDKNEVALGNAFNLAENNRSKELSYVRRAETKIKEKAIYPLDLLDRTMQWRRSRSLDSTLLPLQDGIQSRPLHYTRILHQEIKIGKSVTKEAI